MCVLEFPYVPEGHAVTQEFDERYPVVQLRQSVEVGPSHVPQDLLQEAQVFD